jgi:hypothetical protein
MAPLLSSKRWGNRVFMGRGFRALLDIRTVCMDVQYLQGLAKTQLSDLTEYVKRRRPENNAYGWWKQVSLP